MINDMKMVIMVHHHVQQHHFVLQIQTSNTSRSSSSSDSNENCSHSSSASITRSNNVRKRISPTTDTQIPSKNENKVLMKADISDTVLTIFDDVFGMLDGKLFRWNFSNLFQFGAEIKQWRLFADLNTIFLIMICMSSILKSLCGMSAGATRIAICKYFALKDNETHVLSKENIHETFATLMGMILGVLFTYTLPDDENDNNNNNQFKSVIIIWIVLVLTLIHIITKWYVVKSFNVRAFNRERVIILTSNYMLNKFNQNKLAICKYVSEKENTSGISNLKLFSHLLWCWLLGHHARSVYDDIYGDGKAYIEFDAVYLVTKDWMSWGVQGLKSNNNNKEKKNTSSNIEKTIPTITRTRTRTGTA